ncbi:MAG: alpha/beta hydrolase [Rhodospirillales bacterium]|nr:lysophospholipase [Alphaproteobacteria bacterium]MBL6948565.1 alpha/beta hydrolase [Rhodospirillales bacterium]
MTGTTFFTRKSTGPACKSSARPGRGLALALATGIAVLMGACAPTIRAPGEPIHAPRLDADSFRAADGEVLAVKSWGNKNGGNKTKAVLIALHGFNDYSNFFTEPGAFLADHGIRTYAYDQRGFGASAHPGLWPGVMALSDDLKAFVGVVRERHPGLPLYLLGESMGGAVIMVAAQTGPKDNSLPVNGVILSAPAVWGRITMPWYQRLALWIGVHTMPGVTLTGQGLNIKPSDNREMLLALGRDPLVIKATRIDAIYGLVNLMDSALEKAASFRQPALILYGAKDEIIPHRPTRIMLERLPEAARGRQRIALYKDAYHMLLRDLKAEIPWRDIAGWIEDPNKPLASGADIDSRTRLNDMTERAKKTP